MSILRFTPCDDLMGLPAGSPSTIELAQAGGGPGASRVSTWGRASMRALRFRVRTLMAAVSLLAVLVWAAMMGFRGTDHRDGVSFDHQDGSARGDCTGYDLIGAHAGAARRAAKSAESVRSGKWGVAELGTGGTARRSRLLSPVWWTGPPPIPCCGPPRATNRMTRPPRRSPPLADCLRILDQSLGSTRARSSRNRPLVPLFVRSERAQGWAGRPLP